MNDIVKNTELFVNILGMSRTSAVQKWDREAFQRAFRWAHYFEQVHKKTKSKSHVVEKISKHLTDACSQIDSKIGLSPLSYTDLPSASAILRKNLLENPYLSNDFYLELVSQFHSQPEEKENFKSQLHSLSKLKATLQILQLIQKRFEDCAVSERDKDSGIADDDTTELKMGELAVTKGQITANAVLLRKCLLNVIKQAPSLCNERKFQLHNKLENMIRHERGVDVLLLSLICDDKDAEVSNYLLSFIEDILVPKWKENWKGFLQLPLSKLFSQCFVVYSDFKRVYFDLMQHCGKKLQEEIEKHDFVLLMEKSDCSPNEQMCKYYYFLFHNLLQTLSQTNLECEMQVEAFVRKQCEGLSDHTVTESNVWRKLSHDMMVSSAI
ncbi:uncharacterized protein LOC130655007 [Hydractinia symbiolongicarpus]|uniref:uncharacterized protein LOC130655007 n=1 Tax=Hydractinia symbiolongicarpus TaxID=13093 RepID=UPI00254F68A8|nr:uncharacterized protein LOC130655007 [Hydractinia symbiolongicarpus]